MSQQLLLIGGGHAHLGVLRALARSPLPDTDVTLVSRFDRMIYSGMLSGWIEGHYALDQCTVPLAPVAERAAATFVRDRVVAIDLVERVAYTESGAPLPFDTVSLDIGSEIDRESIHGLAEHALRVRPIQKFVEAWQTIEARFSGAPQAGTVIVIGGGAGGVELALAIAHRVQTTQLRVYVQLITGRPGLLPSLPPGVRDKAARLLPRSGVRLIEDEVVAVGADRIKLARAGELPTDATIAATGGAAARWPRDCGLQCDARGFIAVHPTLQSVSHPFVFAAGDCASIAERPREKSGVHAVRAGPLLAANLRRALAGRSLRRHRSAPTALYLISTGGKNAIGTWGPFSFAGERVWRWKDRIDREFIARYKD